MATQLRTINRILREEYPNIELVKGKGYFYFIFDDGGKKYETLSVMVYALNQMSLERWLSDGRDFIKQCEAE